MSIGTHVASWVSAGVGVPMDFSWLLRGIKFLAGTASIFLLFACGQLVRKTGPFEPYVKSFEKDAATVHKAVSVNFIEMKFGELPAETLALCSLGMGVPLITVNENLWAGLNEIQRQLVIYHELGHCVLKKNHENEDLKIAGARMKLSIMNQHPLDLLDYSNFREEYLAELFKSPGGVGI